MFRKSIALLLAVLFVATFSFTGVNFAQENDEQIIRIGVVPSAESIMIGSDDDFTVTNKVTGDVLYNGSNEQIEVRLDSTAEIQTNFRLQVAFSTNQTYIEDWLHRAEIGGYETYIEPYNDGYRLLIGQFPEDAGWAEREAFRNEIIVNGLGGTDSYWRLITVSSGESLMAIIAGDFETTVENPVVIESPSGLVKMNGKNYRHIGEVAFNSSGTLAGINELPLEEYLYGVVPLELPPVPYGELEAQKSQAVAARTYALSGLGKRSADGYDLLPTTSDQVYGGYDAEHPISTEAVQGTDGIVATYDGELISAVYHSTSGGFTANNEDVWDSGPVPYLRGVPVSERGVALDKVPDIGVFENKANPRSLKGKSRGDFEADWSRYHRWEFEWTAEEMSEVVGTYFNADVSEVSAINVIERSASGRVLEIEFVTDQGSFYEYKDRIRWALQYINDNGAPSVLLSTLFHIEPVENKRTKEVIGYKVYGGGWGHGVGMSQVGAMGMAVKGYTYEDILKHFYRGIELEEGY